ncbi:TPA: phage tail family protein [Bacillus toyonensis]|nr:phage tail family protein [Bacillus toyonensis]
MYNFPEGFTIGGVSNSSLSLIVLDKEVPFMPPISNQDDDTPGMDGAHDFGVKYDPKIIPVKVQVLGAESKADYNKKLRNLATKLNPRIGAKPLIFADEPDKQYFARLSETFDPSRMGLISRVFTLSFICHDPFTYAVTEKEVSFTSGSKMIVHEGGHVAKPILYITKGAGAAALKLTRPDSTTQIIKFTADAPGGVYVLDCKAETALQGTEGAYKYLEEEQYFGMYNGANVINIESGSVSSVRVVYRDTWL